jgi:hypothetical protein
MMMMKKRIMGSQAKDDDDDDDRVVLMRVRVCVSCVLRVDPDVADPDLRDDLVRERLRLGAPVPPARRQELGLEHRHRRSVTVSRWRREGHAVFVTNWLPTKLVHQAWNIVTAGRWWISPTQASFLGDRRASHERSISGLVQRQQLARVERAMLSFGVRTEEEGGQRKGGAVCPSRDCTRLCVMSLVAGLEPASCHDYQQVIRVAEPHSLLNQMRRRRRVRMRMLMLTLLTRPLCMSAPCGSAGVPGAADGGVRVP